MIESVNNKYVKYLTKLNNKKYQDIEGKFLAIGEHLVEEARKTGFLEKAILLEESKEYDDYILVSENVMKKIWFCHAPINGIPCGTCRPCQQKMECKMDFLLPKKSQLRYKIFHVIERTIGKSPAKLYSKFIHSHYFHFFTIIS